MLSNDTGDAIQFRFAESIVVRHSHGREPEFGELTVPFHVNVRRLVSVAGEKEKPVRAALQDGGTRIRSVEFLRSNVASRLSVGDPDKVMLRTSDDSLFHAIKKRSPHPTASTYSNDGGLGNTTPSRTNTDSKAREGIMLLRSIVRVIPVNDRGSPAAAQILGSRRVQPLVGLRRRA